MVTLLAAMALMATGISNGVNNAPNDSVIGDWNSPTKNALIRISQCGTSICGQLMSSDDIRTNPTRKDVNNKKPELRNRPLKGVSMLGDFKPKGNEWIGGWVYNGSDGNTYSGKITIIDKDHIKLRGCVVAPLCKTEEWTRAK